MRNDLLHIMPHMYYTSPHRSSFYNIVPAERLRHRYEQELAQQQAYEEEMAERRYQERLYNELVRQRAQQYAIEEERQQRRQQLVEERRRERAAAREQALRMLLLKEREEEEARKRQEQTMRMLCKPRTRSQPTNNGPRMYQGPNGRLYQEIFFNNHRDNEMNERMAIDCDDEDCDDLPSLIPQSNSPPVFQYSAPVGHRGRAHKKEAKTPVMLRVAEAKPAEVKVAPKAVRKPLIVVEDASDSECEDEFKSYIRNRRPSDGEWMEPVDAFRTKTPKGRLNV